MIEQFVSPAPETRRKRNVMKTAFRRKLTAIAALSLLCALFTVVSVRADEIKKLYNKTQFVCRMSLRIVGQTNGDLPKSWLFQHRWEKGGRCPVDGSALRREDIGGRTTCWCPSCQKPGQAV